jgi:macrolide transport system ATP-binding/permease protein
MVTHEPDLASAAARTISLRDGQIVADERRRPLKETAAPQLSLGKRRGRGILSFAGLRNYCREAVSSLWASKLRSFLSILGVLIGVAAVIAMLALGTGAQRQVQKTLSRLGTNLLQVRSSHRFRGIALGADTVTRFTFADLDAIKRIESVEWAVPYVSGRSQLVYKNRNWNTSVMGASPDFQYVRDAVPDSGRFFTKIEETTRAKVAVLGRTVVKELFGDEDPIGKRVRINRVSFNVIGVMPEKGITGWRNLDDQIVIPITTAMYRLLGLDYISYFDVQVRDTESMPIVQSEIIANLTKLHRIPESETERIAVRNMAEIQEAAGEMVQTFAYLLGAIAAVSLLVGGIGIMNIMLVMVMERTHEIGLRKSLGAENRDIMIQFLVEAVLICVLGGIMGIAFGSFVSWGISFFAGWTIFISLSSIVLAFTFSVMVGIIFGLWPAWRAAKLLPIVALRYE